MIKRFLAFLLSFFIVIAPTYSYAASSWSIKSAAVSGVVTTIVATKDGAAAALKIAPSAGRVGSILLRGANLASLAYAVSQILGDGIDWVMDPDAQGVKYNIQGYRYKSNEAEGVFVSNTAEAEAATRAVFAKRDVVVFSCSEISNGLSIDCRWAYRYDTTDVRSFPWGRESSPTTIKKVLPISQIASKVLSNARSGDVGSQEVAKAAATEMVITGAADTYLQTGAVPGTQVAADDFLFPAIPGDQSDSDTVVVGKKKSNPVDDARDALEAAEKAKAAAEKAARDAADAQRDAADAARDVINAANDAKEAADEQAANAAAADRARAAAEKAAAADRARAAADAADKARADAQAAADKARAAADAAEKVDKLNPSAANKAAKEQALRDAAAADKAVADAIKAAEKAKAAEKEAARKDTKAPASDAFELPPFCSWAAPVCDAVDWLKKDVDTPLDTEVQIEDIAPDVQNVQIVAGGSCPKNIVIPVNFVGQSIDFDFSFSSICSAAETIKPIVILVAGLSYVFIVAGIRGGD